MQLVVERSGQMLQEMALDRPEIIIGRGDKADLTLPEKGVSRQHARLQRGDQGWILVDLGSTNGTFVNGTFVAPESSRPIKPNDVLKLGPVKLLVVGPSSGGQQQFQTLTMKH